MDSQGTDHRAQLAHLSRIEGQVRGIAAMIADDRYCVDILTQLQAVRAALARVERDILDAQSVIASPLRPMGRARPRPSRSRN